MLEEENYKNVVSWGVDGDSFVVKDQTEFSKYILPKHFKHNNFASFVRQLNKYDFHKIRSEKSHIYGENTWEFKHPNFQYNKKTLLELIKRKGPSQKLKPTNEDVGKALNPEIQQQVNNLIEMEVEMINYVDELSSNYNTISNHFIGMEKSLKGQSKILKGLIEYIFTKEINSHHPNNNNNSKNKNDRMLENLYSMANTELVVDTSNIHEYQTNMKNKLSQMEKIRTKMNDIHSKLKKSLQFQQEEKNTAANNTNSVDMAIIDSIIKNNKNKTANNNNTTTKNTSPPPPKPSSDSNIKNNIKVELETMETTNASTNVIPNANTTSLYNQATNQMKISANNVNLSNDMKSNMTSTLATTLANSTTTNTASFINSEANQVLYNNQSFIPTPLPNLLSQPSQQQQQHHQPISPNTSTTTPTPTSSIPTPINTINETPIIHINTTNNNTATTSNNKTKNDKTSSNNSLVRPASKWSQPPRVLLVEDDAICRTLSSRLLQIFGCNFDVAVDGQAAIEHMGGKKYDMVLMDIVMPKIDGVTATNRIRQFDRYTPIISMTSNTTENDCITYLNNGMNDILAKPFNKHSLFSMIERYCSHLRKMNEINTMDTIPKAIMMFGSSNANNNQVFSIMNNWNNVETSQGRITELNSDDDINKVISSTSSTNNTSSSTTNTTNLNNMTNNNNKPNPMNQQQIITNNNLNSQIQTNTIITNQENTPILINYYTNDPSLNSKNNNVNVMNTNTLLISKYGMQMQQPQQQQQQQMGMPVVSEPQPTMMNSNPANGNTTNPSYYSINPTTVANNTNMLNANVNVNTLGNNIQNSMNQPPPPPRQQQQLQTMLSSNTSSSTSSSISTNISTLVTPEIQHINTIAQQQQQQQQQQQNIMQNQMILINNSSLNSLQNPNVNLIISSNQNSSYIPNNTNQILGKRKAN